MKLKREGRRAFITFADLPPNPLSMKELERYRKLGLNVCLLTEDSAKLTRGGQLTEEYRRAIRNIENSGMEVWIRNMHNDPNYFFNPMFKEGSNYGTPYQIEARELTREFSEYARVTGFYMADEPYMYTLEKNPAYPAMDQFDNLVDWKNQYYPDAFFHMNMVPSESYDHFMPRNGEIYDYADFIGFYIDRIVSRLKGGGRSVCLDHYPLRWKGKIDETYLYDLLTAAILTKQYNDSAQETEKATLGICLQTYRFLSPIGEGPLRGIESAEEITFQMYVGMALGCGMFEYFCYRSLEDEELFGILKGDGAERLYAFVKEANDRALGFAERILNFEWKGLFILPGRNRSDNVPAFGRVKELLLRDRGRLLSASAEFDAIAGYFQNEAQEGFMLVNYTDPGEGISNTIDLALDAKNAILRREKGEEISVSCREKLSITLAPGEGCLLIVEKE